VDSVKHSQADFSNPNDSADPAMVDKWSKEEAEAIQNRDAHEDAIDIFDMKVSKGG
jgi:hypothetical protein